MIGGRGAYEMPTSPCPYCGAECEADWCDVGVGMVQCGPYYCQNCESSEASAYAKDLDTRADYDVETGWYRPGSPLDSRANVDAEGRPIGWRQADNEYRISQGVEPRYTEDLTYRRGT